MFGCSQVEKLFSMFKPFSPEDNSHGTKGSSKSEINVFTQCAILYLLRKAFISCLDSDCFKMVKVTRSILHTACTDVSCDIITPQYRMRQQCMFYSCSHTFHQGIASTFAPGKGDNGQYTDILVWNPNKCAILIVVIYHHLHAQIMFHLSTHTLRILTSLLCR